MAMSSESVYYPPRRPRYSSIAREARVEVEQSVDGLTGHVQAALHDLSRNGFQVKVPFPLNAQRPVNLRLRAGGSQTDLSLTGTLRWQRQEDDGAWLAGCETDCPIEWEILGELFLQGVLSTVADSSDDVRPCNARFGG